MRRLVTSVPEAGTAARRRQPWSCVLMLAVCLGPGHFMARSQPASYWDPPVLSQPFDTEPFRPVRPADWVWDTIGAGYTLSVLGAEARGRAAAAGVTLSEMGFVDPFYAYYESRLLKRRSPHVPLDRLGKDLAEYRRLGVRVLGVYPPTLQSEVYELHPDWRRVPTNTREVPQVDLARHPHGGPLCLLGPYGDFFIEVLVEIATQFTDVAAFSFDGLHHGGVCYCGHCRTQYRADTGQEIPDVDMENPAFRRYQHWADRRLERMVSRMQARLKSIRPSLALVTWTTNAGRYGHLRDIPRNMPARLNLLFDAPDQEFWLDESNRGATILPAFANAYVWAVSNHRVAFSEPYLMSHGNPYGKDSFPGHEIERRMLLALTYGAAPSIAVLQPEHMQEATYRAMAQVQQRKSWLTRKQPEPWAALVMSDNTRNFYGRHPGQVEERYLANVLGMFRMAVEEHLPMTLLNDWNLTAAELARFKVLLLPNTACLDTQQIAAIRGFVQNGGGLVASLDTSLCDEFGDSRPNLALADVLGVQHGGVPIAAAPGGDLDVNFARNLPPEYWTRRRHVWDFQTGTNLALASPKLRELIGKSPVTFKGPAIRVGTNSLAQPQAVLAPKPGESGETIPAILKHAYGQGRVVYFAAGLDAAYYLYGYPYQRVILRNAVSWAAAAPPPVEVQAPLCVHAVLMRQKHQGERLVLHLFNDINTTAFHGLPDQDVPLREETIPIHDIQVTWRGYRIRHAHLEPGGISLPLKPMAGELGVTVPRLDVHVMVIAELEP